MNLKPYDLLVRSQVLRSRLGWRIALAVFLSVLAVEAVVLAPTYHNYERDLQLRLEEAALAGLKANIALADITDLAALGEAGRRTMPHSPLRGGAVYDRAGRLVATFGEEPANLRDRIDELGQARSWSPTADRHEALWTPDRTGLPLFVLGRMEQASIEAELTGFIWRNLGLVTFISAVVSALTMLVLGHFVLQPVLVLRENMVAAQRDPDNPERYTVEVTGNDELSDAFTAFNAMLLRISDNYRRQAEAQESRFKDFADSGSDYFWEMDANLRFSYFSERYTEITGVPLEALLGKTREEAPVPNIDPEALKRHLADLAAHRAFRNFVLPRTRPDGREVWVSLSAKPFFGPGGEFLGYRGTGRDITEKKLAETALLAAKEQAETAQANLIEALEAMSEGFALYDEEDRLVVCNSKHREFWSSHADAIVPGASYRSILEAGLARGTFPDAIGRERQWLTECLVPHSQPVQMIEQRMEGDRWLRTNERRTRAGGTVSTKMDISELKEREDELKTAKRQAERANQAKSEFLANMSHELRTPLNAIIGFSEIIMCGTLGTVGNARYAEYAGDINSSGLHLLNLINEILDLSKIEAGKLELQESAFNIQTAFETCLAIVADPAAEAGLTLETDLPGTLPELWADELKIKQVVINLLSNALKFSEPGGAIRLRARVGSNGSFVFSVGDDGIGMSADEIPIALAPFGQVSGSLDRTHTGTGLGLPLTKALVELHGGHFEIESQSGVGTTVTVRLPSARLRATESVTLQQQAG